MAYTLMIIGKDPGNRLTDHCPDYSGCPDETCPLCNATLVITSTGCSNCFAGDMVPIDGPATLGPTDAAEAYVFTFDNKDAAQSWIDSWPSPSTVFHGKLVYGFSPDFPEAGGAKKSASSPR